MSERVVGVALRAATPPLHAEPLRRFASTEIDPFAGRNPSRRRRSLNPKPFYDIPHAPKSLSSCRTTPSQHAVGCERALLGCLRFDRQRWLDALQTAARLFVFSWRAQPVRGCAAELEAGARVWQGRIGGKSWFALGPTPVADGLNCGKQPLAGAAQVIVGPCQAPRKVMPLYEQKGSRLSTLFGLGRTSRPARCEDWIST